jgi:hypothetical protein
MILDINTNLDGSNGVFAQAGTDLNYVLEQTYGRNVSTLNGTAGSYAQDGISVTQFADSADLEGDGFNDFTSPLNQSRAWSLAQWQPSGAKKAGFVIYGIDLDGPDFTSTIAIIPILNP